MEADDAWLEFPCFGRFYFALDTRLFALRDWCIYGLPLG